MALLARLEEEEDPEFSAVAMLRSLNRQSQALTLCPNQLQAEGYVLAKARDPVKSYPDSACHLEQQTFKSWVYIYIYI